MNYHYNDHNKKVNQYCEAQIPLIREFLNELSPHGITHFCHVKSIDYKNYFVLDPHIKEFRDSFGYEKDNGIIMPQLEASNKNIKYSLWQNIGHASAVAGFFINKNINHGIALFRKISETHQEIFHFASTNDNPKILDFYLNNLALLDEAADRFVQKLSIHSDPSILPPLAQLNIKEDFHFNSLEIKKRKSKRTIVYIHQNNHHSHEKVETLSNKQLLCLEFLRQGYTAKQIAQMQGISYRTVEGHIQILLRKFELMSRYDLIRLPMTFSSL